MICYEQGLIALDDPLSKFIPNIRRDEGLRRRLVGRTCHCPPSEPIKIWHLLTHTSGLTYGWLFDHPVDAMIARLGRGEAPPDLDLAGCCSRLAEMPLRCQPGTEWNYSTATDVLGRVVEVATGQVARRVPGRARARSARHE